MLSPWLYAAALALSQTLFCLSRFPLRSSFCWKFLPVKREFFFPRLIESCLYSRAFPYHLNQPEINVVTWCYMNKKQPCSDWSCLKLRATAAEDVVMGMIASPNWVWMFLSLTSCSLVLHLHPVLGLLHHPLIPSFTQFDFSFYCTAAPCHHVPAQH